MRSYNCVIFLHLMVLDVLLSLVVFHVHVTIAVGMLVCSRINKKYVQNRVAGAVWGEQGACRARSMPGMGVTSPFCSVNENLHCISQ